MLSADLFDEPFDLSMESQDTVIVSSDSNISTLVVNEQFRAFPQHGCKDFSSLRSDPELAYFDRTNYISVLESFKDLVLLFLRPRRFGKSLTLSMLAHFHGVEHKAYYDKLFKVNSDNILLILLPLLTLLLVACRVLPLIAMFKIALSSPTST